MSADIRDIIRQLAKIRLDEGLIMSLYLDLSPDPKGQRHYQSFMKKRFSELEKQYPPRSPLHGYLTTNIREINRYLKEELDSRSRGLALFISQSKRFFSAIQTAIPFENRVAVSRLPYVYPLVRMADDFASYGVMISDEWRARLVRVNLGQVVEQADILTEADEVSAKGYQTRKGRLGWSDEKHQRHLKDIIAKHIKSVVAESRKFFGRDVSCLLLSADNLALAEINRQLPAELKGKVVATPKFDMKTPMKKVLEESLKIYKERENQDSLKLARQAVVLGTGKGGRAVVGTEATLDALQGGQAETLVISEQYRDQGWKCRGCLHLGSGGKAAKCPFCRHPDVAGDIDMKEEMVEAAIRRGARVEFYSGPSELDKYGRVGALLR
jgi:hypothetical protein